MFEIRLVDLPWLGDMGQQTRLESPLVRILIKATNSALLL